MQTMTDQKTRARRKKEERLASEQPVSVDLKEIRARISDLLNRLGARLIDRVADTPANAADEDAIDPVTVDLQGRVAQLGQLAAGLAVVDPDCLPADGAGYGSTVQVRTLDTGETDEYTLMVGVLVDLAANQVSLASPVGQALLGKRAGDRVTVTTPYKKSQMFIMKVVTLVEQLERYETNAVPNQRVFHRT